MSASTTTDTRTLSERESKALLAPHGVPFLDEAVVATTDEAVAAAEGMGFPVVAKLNGDAIAHKTERGLVKLSLGDAAAVRAACDDLLAAARPEDGDVSLLVAPMVKSNREFICGVSTDPQFGPTVLLGVGGILAEAIADVSIRLAPIDAVDAAEMLEDLATQDLLGAFRGEPAVDRDALAGVLLALSDAVTSHDEIRSIDCNPVLVVDGKPVAVDALVEVTR
ncbi:MAG: acetate--CoA ligase family protein [Acidimicrobiales bacterium]